MQTRLDAQASGAHPRHAVVDDGPVLSSEEVDADAEPLVAGEPPAPVTEEPAALAAEEPPAPAASEAAKDRLLAVLLRDPAAALRALAAGADAAETSDDPEAGLGASATDLLRAGLSPTQVAQLIGVDESELASVVARGLGLLGGGQDAVGRNRTDDPGRSWANAGSAPGATTPTTG